MRHSQTFTTPSNRFRRDSGYEEPFEVKVGAKGSQLEGMFQGQPAY
jgi:alpha-L-arabinofuranosidase